MKNIYKFFRIAAVLLLTALLLSACTQPQADVPPQSSEQTPIPADMVGLVMYADAQQMTIMVHTPSAEIKDYKNLGDVTLANTGNAEIVEVKPGAILQYVQMGGLYPANLNQFMVNTMIAVTHDATGNQVFIILDYASQPKDERQLFGKVTEVSDSGLTMALYQSSGPISDYADLTGVTFVATTATKIISLSQVATYQAIWEEELVLAQKPDLVKDCFIAVDTAVDGTLTLTILTFPESK